MNKFNAADFWNRTKIYCRNNGITQKYMKVSNSLDCLSGKEMNALISEICKDCVEYLETGKAKPGFAEALMTVIDDISDY